ncbi:MAG: LysE family translocator [Kordiimonadaceae bacterium]|jgi:threonine/homoserine/homoserine lactone efflux protein|nr:LysE family translocator [Kordiimonadaceae bacterium]MBT6034889.1 LysE family translocator [Kordiimonadaceae bacterium]MBT6329784.1 LysE family translocator [Kordiimonadaceae bacterium]MBT7582336.1 LysE family translocator [Kordiimonadaceae bacterium]
MPSVEQLIPFIIAAMIFAFIPGPAILYTAAQTLAKGKRGGAFAAFGIHVGGMAHIIAAAAGLSAVFTHSPLAYTALKIFGAVYLVWLGIGIIRGKLDASELPHMKSNLKKRVFFDSMMVEILNPKVIIFYIAFLPQFVDPTAAYPLWLQFVILGTINNILFSLVDICVIFLTSAIIGGLKKSERPQKIMRWVSGSTLMGLGVNLAISDK